MPPIIINLGHLRYLTLKNIHNPVTRVFSAPIKYISRVKDAIVHCHIQTGSRTYPVGKARVTQTIH
jgi:hypothetical protein